MRAEYSNIYFVSMNKTSGEVAIIFKQDVSESLERENEVIDISKIVLTVENAKELSRLIDRLTSKERAEEA